MTLEFVAEVQNKAEMEDTDENYGKIAQRVIKCHVPFPICNSHVRFLQIM
jgi:hypothetical protein